MRVSWADGVAISATPTAPPAEGASMAAKSPEAIGYTEVANMRKA